MDWSKIIVKSIVASILITKFQIYNFETRQRWIEQYIGLVITYSFVYGVIAFTIEKTISCV